MPTCKGPQGPDDFSASGDKCTLCGYGLGRHLDVTNSGSLRIVPHTYDEDDDGEA